MKESENILVLGLGGLGYYLTKRLSQEGHQVTVIEQDASLIAKGQLELDARLIQGDATDFRVWQKANAEENDYLVAMTNNDAVNILASILAQKFNIAYKLVRNSGINLWAGDAVLTPKDLGINHLIRPEELAAQEVARLCRMRAGNVVVDVGDHDLQVVAIHVTRHSMFSHMLVSDISQKYDQFPFQIVCVTRDIRTIIPYGNFKIEPDDHIFILVNRENLKHLLDFIEISELNKRNVMIVGGGVVGSRVAELLQDDFDVRLIETFEDKAERLSFQLKRTTVLHGDGANKDTLVMAGVEHMDTVVASTTDNETNIMVTVLAKHLIRQKKGDGLCSERTIALIKREEYSMLASALGTNFAVNDKILAANEVMRYLRRGHVLSVCHLHGCDAEVVELLADPGSKITTQKIKNFKGTFDKIRIGAIKNDQKWIIANGEMQVVAGDRVICICEDGALGELQRMFLS